MNPLEFIGSDNESRARFVGIPYARPEDPEKLYEQLPLVKRGSSKAAEWRLRCRRQIAIDNELSKHGEIALMCGTLFNVLSPGTTRVERYVRTHNVKYSVAISNLYERLDWSGRAGLLRAKYDPYTRLEHGIRAMGHMLCLAVEDIQNEDLIRAFDSFKLKAISLGLRRNAEGVDRVLSTIKQLGKLCQATFLGRRSDEDFSDFIKDGILLPFDGPLKWISDNQLGLSRIEYPLNLERAEQLGQLSNLPRALPYPSKDQVTKSILDTVKTFMTPKVVSEAALLDHRQGLVLVAERLGAIDTSSEHVSLIAKGCFEASRSQGGRASVLVKAARKFCSQVIDKEIIYDYICCGYTDVFGQTLFSEQIHETVIRYRDKQPQLTVGDLLYMSGLELEKRIALGKVGSTPLHLGQIITLAATGLLEPYGRYSRPAIKNLGIYAFPYGDPIRFRMTSVLPVNADVSIESGMKTRLTTSAVAAFAHLSQLPSNLLRKYLSKDPFHKVGFLESDKLWEVLKMYEQGGSSIREPRRPAPESWVGLRRDVL